MKKVLLCATLYLTIIVSATPQSLTRADRSKVLNHLKQTEEELLKTVKGLSTEQLNDKPDEDAWSMAECIEHIAATAYKLSEAFQMWLDNHFQASIKERCKGLPHNGGLSPHLLSGHWTVLYA